jgi:hypothetical protein
MFVKTTKNVIYRDIYKATNTGKSKTNLTDFADEQEQASAIGWRTTP